MTSGDQGHSIRSVERAIDLLAVLESSPGPMGLSELSRAANMPKATALRLLAVLGKRGLVEKAQGRYQIGVATVPLAHAFLVGNNLSRAALPVMQELAAVSKETASLFVRLGFHRVVVQRVEGVHPLRYTMPIGERLPLHLGAGKILAAAMPEDELRPLLDQLGEVRRASGEVLTKDDFLAELQRVREHGFSISINERTLGVASVAAPIVGQDGTTIAALAVIGPSESVTPDRIPQLSVEVRRAAQAIAERYRRL